MRLAGVFDDDQVVATGDLPDGVHLGWLTVQVDRYDRLRARRHRGFEQLRIEVIVLGRDVDEHRIGARVGNREGSRSERVGRGDDFIAGAHAELPQRQVERVGSAGDGHTRSRPAIIGELFFELADFLTEYEARLPYHTLDGRHDFIDEFTALGFQIHEGNFFNRFHNSFPARYLEGVGRRSEGSRQRAMVVREKPQQEHGPSSVSGIFSPQRQTIPTGRAGFPATSTCV